MSGYDLKQLINRSITHFYWSPAKSQIYGELRRLESHGLVTMREVPQTLRREKRLYQITPEGTEAMQQWLRSSGLEPDSYKSALLLKVFFGHMLSYDTTIGLLEERRKQIAQELAACERRVQEFQDRMRGAEADDETFFPLLTLQRSIMLSQADLEWLDGALGQLRQRQAHASTRRGRRKTSSNGSRSRMRAV
jgi:DNA-binding PadR family transcriptional regulator